MDDLLGGALAPGSWMRQDEIADRLGVSKIPVREALQRLAAVGLVRFETNRGAFVPELTSLDAEETYALRRSVEARLLNRSVPMLRPADFAAAERALEQGASTTANWTFHRALYAPSRWNRGLAIAEMLHAAVAPYVALYVERLGGGTESDAQHDELLHACRNGDTERALVALDSHLADAADVLIGFLDRQDAVR
jgi:DNA-binding GntR family transcriptional regulator